MNATASWVTGLRRVVREKTTHRSPSLFFTLNGMSSRRENLSDLTNDQLEARVRSAEAAHARASADLAAARLALDEATSESAHESAAREALDIEMRVLEDEIAALSREAEDSRAALAKETEDIASETAALEAAISKTEAENAARRADIAARLHETQASTAEATTIVSQLRAQASQRAALADEATQLRARLQERRALGLHNELVAITRATKSAMAVAAARADELRSLRDTQQAELRALSLELETLRRDVAIEIANKERNDATLLGLDAALLHTSSDLERLNAIAARSSTS